MRREASHMTTAKSKDEPAYHLLLHQPLEIALAFQGTAQPLPVPWRGHLPVTREWIRLEDRCQTMTTAFLTGSAVGPSRISSSIKYQLGNPLALRALPYRRGRFVLARIDLI